MSDWISGLVNSVSNIGNQIASGASSIASRIGNELTNAVNQVGETISNALNDAWEAFTGAVEGIGDYIGDIIAYLSQIADSVVEIADALVDSLGVVGDYLGDMVNNLVAFSENLPQIINEIFEDAFTFLIDTLGSLGGGFVGSIADSILTTMNKVISDAFASITVGEGGIMFSILKGVPRTHEGYPTWAWAWTTHFVLVIIMLIIGFLASIEVSILGTKVSFNEFANVISEVMGETISEAFEEVYDWWVVNAVSNVLRGHLGGEWMDDDEIKDVASSGLFDIDTLAYWGVRTGLTNTSAVGEVATGLSYNTEANVRFLMSALFNALFETVEVRTRTFRRLLEEADTKTLDALRWAKRVYDRAYTLIRSEAKKVHELIREYRKLVVEWELVRDDPNITEAEKNTIANMIAKLEDEIPQRYLELVIYARKVFSIADETSRYVSEYMDEIMGLRNEIARRYDQQIQNRIIAIINGMKREYDTLIEYVKRVINMVYTLRKQSDLRERWSVVE